MISVYVPAPPLFCLHWSVCRGTLSGDSGNRKGTSCIWFSHRSSLSTKAYQLPTSSPHSILFRKNFRRNHRCAPLWKTWHSQSWVSIAHKTLAQIDEQNWRNSMPRLLDIEASQFSQTVLAEHDDLAKCTPPAEIAHPKVTSTKMRDTKCCWSFRIDTLHSTWLRWDLRLCYYNCLKGVITDLLSFDSIALWIFADN